MSKNSPKDKKDVDFVEDSNTGVEFIGQDSPVIYIFLNKALGMSVGKASAQVAHAAIMAMTDVDESRQQLWKISPHKTVIVLEGRDEAHIKNISEYLKQRSIYTNMIIDEGVNEIDAHTITALSTGILNKDDERVAQTFSTFKLYKDKVRITLELDK